MSKALKKVLNEVIKNEQDYNGLNVKEVFNKALKTIENKPKSKELRAISYKRFYNKNELKEKIKCQCGGEYSYYNKFNHKKSKLHKEYEANN